MTTATERASRPTLRILDHMLVLLETGASLPHACDFVACALLVRESESFVRGWIVAHT